MATTIVLKNSSTTGAVPTTGQLVQGEVAVNVTDRKLFTKTSTGTVVEIGGGARGTGSDDVFYENSQTVTQSYTITAGKNALAIPVMPFCVARTPLPAINVSIVS